MPNHDIPLKRNVAVSDGDHGKLKLLGRGAEGEKQSQDIVDPGVGVKNNTLLGSHCDCSCGNTFSCWNFLSFPLKV